MPLSQSDRDSWRSPAIGATGLIIGGLGAISLIRNMAHTPTRALLYLNRITSPRLYGYDIIPSLWSSTTLHAGTALTTGAILCQLSDSDRAQRFGATLSDSIQQPDLIQTVLEASHELVHNTATQTAVALRNPTALLLMQSVGYHAAMRILPRTRSQQLLAVGIGIVGSTAMYLTPYALHPDLRGLTPTTIEIIPRPTALPERAETSVLSSNTRAGGFIAERESEVAEQLSYLRIGAFAGTQIAARNAIIEPRTRPDQRITALMEFGGAGMATGIYPALMALPISLARRHLTGVGMIRLEEHLEGLLTPQIQEVAERHIPSPVPTPDSQPPPVPPELPTETPSQEMPPESQPPLIPLELPTQTPTQDTLSSESTASREDPSPSGVRQEADIQDMPSPPTLPEPSASSPQIPTQVAPLETEIEQPPSPPERAQEATTQDLHPQPVDPQQVREGINWRRFGVVAGGIIGGIAAFTLGRRFFGGGDQPPVIAGSAADIEHDTEVMGERQERVDEAHSSPPRTPTPQQIISENPELVSELQANLTSPTSNPSSPTQQRTESKDVRSR